MNKYVYKNAVFPTTAIYSKEAIISLFFLGLSNDVTDEIIDAYGYELLPLESNSRTVESDVLIVDKENDTYVVKWVSIDEWNMIQERNIASLRAKTQRNRLLSESDWTQTIDCPLSNDMKNSWALYRQQLRDITKQSEFPSIIAWPTKPL